MRGPKTLVPLTIRPDGEGFRVALVPRLDREWGWLALFLGSWAFIVNFSHRGLEPAGLCLLLAAGIVFVGQTQQWKLRCDLMNLEVAREIFGVEWDRQKWPLAAIRAFEPTFDGEGLAIHFRRQSAWSIRLAFDREGVNRLAEHLEAARSANARFWRDEVHSGRARDESELARMIDRSP